MNRLRNAVLGLGLFLLLMTAVSPASAWDILIPRVGSASPVIHSSLCLLDPDDWTSAEVRAIGAGEVLPIAWLMVSRAEAGRYFLRGLDSKLMILPKIGPKPANPPVRFYQQAWKNVLYERLRELAQKGFKGVFITGIDEYRGLSDNPVAASEMGRLLGELARTFRGQCPDGLIILHGGRDFWNDPRVRPNIHGIAVDGVWVGADRRLVHAFQRKKEIARLQALRQKGLRVLTVESPTTGPRRDLVTREAAEADLEPTFFPLPIFVKRSFPNGTY